MTSQGHPRTVFRRALERGNLLVAEATAHEVGQIDLREALELSALVSLANRDRGQRFCVRWLQRWLDEAPQPPAADEAAMVAACLAALGGPGHHDALASLRAVAERATTGLM